MTVRQRPSKAPNSFDVARLAGVHRSAVSRAFSDKASISEATRKKVLKAAESLGYRVNYLARGLHGDRSGLVGIIASRLDSSYRARQVRSATDALLANNCTPILVTAEDHRDINARFSILLNYNVDAILVTSDSLPSEMAAHCQRMSVPVVMINRDPTDSDVNQVQINTETAGKLALNMLRARGATRFAVLMPVMSSLSVSGRAQAFAARARKTGYPLNMIETDGISYQDGREAAETVLARLDAFDGLFATSDHLAFGLLDGLRGRGPDLVPERLQIVGFDDIEQAAWSGYNLSTIAQSIEGSAQNAVELLMRRLKDPVMPPETLDIPLQPIHRGTTRALNGYACY